MSETILDYVTRLTDQLSPEEKLMLVKRLTDSQRRDKPSYRVPVSLRGVWQEYFPGDFEVDGALREVRHEWEKEWPEVFNK
ncbi:MAG TPA: hypothetical protein VF762_15650 [Blastocatellia bacterium]|jgi:hypothetical protein